MMRRFAFWNIIFWVIQQPVVVLWYLFGHQSFVNGLGILYVAFISVSALWLSSLAWWQSTKVEEQALTVDELVHETSIEPS